MILDEFILTDETALVTGAHSEAGRAICALLAEAGADVVAVGPFGERMEDTAAAVEAHGRRVLPIGGDLTDAGEVERIVQEALGQFGKIDILVNGYQAPSGGAFLELSVDEWRRVQDANVTPAFLFSRAVGAHMAERGRGKIVNVAHSIGMRGVLGASAFASSQAAIIELTHSLAVELAPKGIKVNAAVAGWLGEGEGEQEESLQHYLTMKRRGTWDELANMVLFLACNGCDFLTGKAIGVDGGMLAHA